MTVFRLIFCGLFALMGFGVLVAAWSGRSPRLFLGAMCYLGAAVAAIQLSSWWPLLIGFVLAFMVRAVFGDPSRE